MRRVRMLGSLFGTLVLALLATLAISTATGWLHITPVLSGSMRGAFNPGDALLTERVPLSSLHVGDVVDVTVPPQDGQPATQRVHRIVSLVHRGSELAIRTKGDANATVDPGTIMLHGDQYVMRARLPYVGWIVDFKADNGQRLLLLAIAGLGILSVGQQLWLTTRSKHRRRHGASRRSTAAGSTADSIIAG